MNISLADLKSQHLSLEPLIYEAISRVLHSGSYVMGPEVEAFEEEWAEYCGARYCIGVSSGTDALYLALIAYKGENLPKQVITTPLTFFATTQAIIQAGMTPRFIDVDSTGNLPDIKSELYLILPVHLYGRPGNWTGDNVIEDAAQAHGVKLKGKVMCTSFYPTKNLGAYGQAGAVVTNDERLAKSVRVMSTFCVRERFVDYGLTGYFRMEELQAAILRVKLPYLDMWNNLRREIARKYRERLLSLKDLIQLPEDHPQHVYHIYAIRCKRRDELAAFLNQHGIQTAVRYPVPMHLQPALRYLGHHKGDFPQAEAWAKENLSLPMYPEMNQEQVEYVCEKVHEWAKTVR